MEHYKYIIVGGGMAADAAAQGIRKEDTDGSVLILSAELHPPYNRPPLSKDTWTDNMPLEDLYCHTKEHNVDVLTARRVETINPQEKSVRDHAQLYTYDKLLLATGGAPVELPFSTNDRAVYYRTMDDLCRVKTMAQTTEHFAVIGGSFIGCEMAAALLSAKKEVTMIFPETSPFRRLFPKEVSVDLLRLFEEQGAEMVPGVKLSDMCCGSTQCRLKLENGQILDAGAAVIGIGVKPNTELAESAGLKTEDGIEVNRQLQTTHPDIYAAGDAVRFYNPALDRFMRVEHEDHALQSGKTAGRNMAGQSLAYDHLPFFYSDLFGRSCEAVGVLDSSLQTEEIWNGIDKPGVWAYLEDRRVCGVLMWNLSGRTELARALIAEPEPLSANELKLRLGTFIAEESE